MANTKASASKTTSKAKTTKTAPKAKVEEAVAEAKKPEAKAEGKMYTQDELNALIAQKIAEALANSAPSVVQVQSQEDMVRVLFIGAIAKGSAVDLGSWGQIYSDGGMIDVPKRLFVSGISATVNSLLEDRKLIVVSGLDDGERERYGVLYKESELLTSEMYGKLLDYDADHLEEIYKKLCDEHKKIVARVIYSAVIDGDKRVNNNKIAKIVKIDRARGVRDTALDEIYRRIEL